MTADKAEKAVRNKLDRRGLIGHGAVVSFIDKAIAADRLAHAYLFIGPPQVGKMELAKRLAAAVIGGETALDRHPDFLVVERGRDPKSGKLHADIVLDQVHTLRGWLARGALLGGWKVAVIDGAQCLNKESANALLKNLEEPQPGTLLLLLADAADTLYPTIKSRCQVLDLGRVRHEDIEEALRGEGVDSARAVVLARLAGGCPGRALDYARRPELFAAMDERRRLFLELAAASVADRWAILDKVLPPKLPFNEAGEMAGQALDLLAELLRDALLAAHGRGEALVHADLAPQLEAWSSRLGPDRLAGLIDQIADARGQLGQNVGPRAVLENLALSF